MHLLLYFQFFYKALSTRKHVVLFGLSYIRVVNDRKLKIWRKFKIELTVKKITMVAITNSHCECVIISGTIFYSWDYYNNIVKSTIIILYYIFLVDIAIKNSCRLREI